MADAEPPPSLRAPEAATLTVLTTEHFALQGVRGTGSSEAISRASLYLAALSSALIALGFATASPALFAPFAATVLPVVFVLGVLTFLRLVYLGVQDLQRQQDIERLRSLYRQMTAELRDYYPELAWRSPRALMAAMGMRAGPLQLFSTAAAMVAIVNAAVAGIGTGLLLLAIGPTPAIVVGILVAVGLVGAGLAVQWSANVRAFDGES